MNSIERFKNKKSTLQKIEQRKGLSLVADQDLVNNLLTSEVDFNAIQASNDRLNEQYDFNPDVKVATQEVNDLLLIMKNDFDDNRFNELVSACKKDVVSAIITPFGLGKFVSKFDKNGGNVDTINNVRQGVYATEEERKKYENRKEYNSDDYHCDKKYIETNRQHSQQQKNSTLTDAYTGKPLTSQEKRNLDHVVSAKEIHDDPARTLAKRSGVELANDNSNLQSTGESINKSKKADKMTNFSDKVKKDEINRKKRIVELSQKASLTEKEQKELKKHQEIDNFNHEKAREIDRIAREKYEKELNKYYRSEEFITNTAKTSINEGAKMGIQQALGLVIYEFFNATFDELEDIYKNGFSSSYADDRFIHVIKERFSRIAIRIASRWKDVGTAFADGFISGLLSNLVTVVINMFVRTGKRMVRMIREGFFSLLRAIKMLCFPPQGMTGAQAAHEASKLIATGLVVIGGIAIEQHIDVMIKAAPMLEPLADILTSILVGGLTGIAVTLIVYAIDKIDFFQVNEHDKHTFIMNKLENSLSVMFTESDLIIADMKI